MKKLISMTLALTTAMALIATPCVFADESAMATASNSTNSTNSTNSAMSAKDFQARKAKVLEHIGDRIAKMQEIQSCVKAANNLKSMHDCKPH